ncbi:MAG: carboxypeptidase-like regulatory domain-containing protein, partial [Candidatus Marinimicrobia bacterium]|nr:carboxypeptidase-like regulatory domain-containing protein [Candidatus Neomarinimicrobiota bacterium]
MFKYSVKLFTALLIVALPAMVFAGQTGKIMGTVTDKANGNLLPGVNVVLVGTNMGAATDANGKYYILNIPPGLYTIRFSFIGYAEITKENIRVTIDLAETQDAQMESETIAGKEVNVTAEKPLI